MKIDTRLAVRLAFLPVACAALLTACAPYEPYGPVYGTAQPVGSPPAPLSMFDRLDTNRDGFLSRAEVEPLGVRSQTITAESAAAAFRRLDANGDGFLSRAEAEATLSGIPGSSFDASDANRDGFLSLAEAMPHLRWLESRGAAGSLSFEALDSDRDGFLTRAEADPLLRSAQWSDGRWVVGAPVPTFSFDRLDGNRDGFISRAEAAGAITSATFDRYDVNRDGFLSPAEADHILRPPVGGTPGTYGGAVYSPR